MTKEPLIARLPDPPSGASWYACQLDIANTSKSTNSLFDDVFDKDTAGAFVEFLVAATSKSTALSIVSESLVSEGLKVKSVEEVVRIASADDLPSGLKTAVNQWDRLPEVVRGQMIAYGRGELQ